MKLSSIIFTVIFLSGCQSLAPSKPVIKPAEVLSQPHFTVPRRAARHLQFDNKYQVTLSMIIDKSGEINQISVIKSSGIQSLDLAAMQDARKMTFKAGTKDNEFIATKVILPIDYIVPKIN